MQARLEPVRYPALLFAIVFALVAALSLGTVLGYTLKPTMTVQQPPQVIYVQGLPSSATSSSNDGCVWISGTTIRKAC